jgi:crotonobetainyl-CoA:carnitine CoA-transferase CaiB-like acyl-CoA transferase
MYQLATFVMPEALIHYQATGEELPRRGDEDLDTLLSGVYPAAGTDRWLAVSVGDGAALHRLLDVVGAGADEDVAAEELLRLWAAERDAGAAAAQLQAAGIAAGPVMDACDLLTDPTLRARRFYEPVEFDGLGARPLISRPYTWESTRTHVAIQGPGPRWGADNARVLNDIVRYDPARVAALHEADVVTDSPVAPGPTRTQDLDMMVVSGVLARVDENYVDVLTSGDVATA